MKREYVKFAVTSIANFAAGFVVTSALKNAVPVESKAQLVLRFIGVAVVSGALQKPISKYVDTTFDETASNLGFPMPEEKEEV